MTDNLDSQDLETAEWLKNQFSSVEYSRESPASTLTSSRTSKVIRIGIPMALAASIAAVAMAVLPLGPTGSDKAWAAEPTPTTAADRDAIRTACQKPLSQGLGELEQMGVDSVTGDTRGMKSSAAPAVGNTLPKDMIVDRRKDSALALFEDETQRVVCPLKFDGAEWHDQGVSVMPKDPSQDAGLSFSGQTAWLDGTTFSYESGLIPKGKTCAAFNLSDGKRATASCNLNSYAIWFPSDVSFVGAKITFF